MSTAAEPDGEIASPADHAAPLDQPDQLDINHEVGYGKPPKVHQFKKGVSGNPRGRKKNKRIDDIRDLTDRVLDEAVQVKQGNRVRTVSSLEAALAAYRREALSGNPRAARNFFKLAAKAGMLSKVRPQSFAKLMEPGGDDGKVIRMFRAEQEQLTHAHNKASGDTGEPSAPPGASRSAKRKV
jgi:hypothetical protein